MSIEDDGVQRPRVSRRRKQLAGVIGLAAVLGGGAYAITSATLGDNSAKTQSVGMIDAVPTESSAPAKQALPKASASSFADDQKRIKAAREAAAKARNPVRHARTAASVAAPERGNVTVTNTGSLKEGGSMRVVSAPYDLTGQREMLWIAEPGRRVGDARCTSTIQLSNEGEPAERPTLLLCYRTSAKKSVITVAVVPTGRPDAAKSVAALDQQWAKMN
ncbi:hypothetical protein [Paractinoplanes toevensis]|uniref:Uncharacterized protein n=1 Tax=Paractinoplanes toevensis TaxID=571911 RepID=A0A919WCM6_9ACTN|nr:hypothetical protein [Actinoplanes toevensis]GIM97774.1 hypothetical protein Ato02nite_095670 [Actinoplanes toevensis]